MVKRLYARNALRSMHEQSAGRNRHRAVIGIVVAYVVVNSFKPFLAATQYRKLDNGGVTGTMARAHTYSMPCGIYLLFLVSLSPVTTAPSAGAASAGSSRFSGFSKLRIDTDTPDERA